ncbi:MAG: DUF4332 domain-containing protein [Chloroflexi bacterium]|nr:MAG: DUF4332 domain-containing protein [Chloroflexota bacterium]
MTNLLKVEGIGESYARKLKDIGITTVEALLERGATPKGRDEIAEKADISGNLVLEWVNHCDLFRVRGIGEEYSDLLEEAGVDTVVELAQRNPENLFAALVKINEEKQIVRKLPTLSLVTNWVEQAKKLGRKISY